VTKQEFATSIEAAVRERYESNVLRDLHHERRGTAEPQAGDPKSRFLAETASFLRHLAKQHEFGHDIRNLERYTSTVYYFYMSNDLFFEAKDDEESDLPALRLEFETSFLTSAPDLDQMDRNFARLVMLWNSGLGVRIWVAALPTTALLTRHLTNCKTQIDKCSRRNEDVLFLFVLFDQSTGQTTVDSHSKAEEDPSASDPSHDTVPNLPIPYQNPAPGRGHHALRHLRTQLLSLPPGDDLDKLIFRTLEPHGVDHFLEVSRLLTYHEKGRVKAVHGDESKVLIASIEKQNCYSWADASYNFYEGFDPFSQCSSDADEATIAAVFRDHEAQLKDSYSRGHYVRQDALWQGSDEPVFKSEWTELPRCTTDIDVALRLKDDIFPPWHAIPLILEEIRTTPASETEEVDQNPSYCAELRDPNGPTTRSPALQRPAMAVLVATVDHLLKIMGEEPTAGSAAGDLALEEY